MFETMVSSEKNSDENDISLLPIAKDTCLLKAGDWLPSPNFNERRATIDRHDADDCSVGQVKIDLLLMHYTATPTNAYALELLTSAEAGVSSHYLVDGQGRIIQMVAEGKRAWHAGEGEWAGECDINSCSIGIEIQNQGYALSRVPAYGERQMAAVTELCSDIVHRHKIKPSRVLGHSDVAPHRKQDPGAHFDWERLALVGAGIWLEPPEVKMMGNLLALDSNEITTLQAKLSEIGYGIEQTGKWDKRTHLVVTAFQRHYRPLLVDGVVDEQTYLLVDQLLGVIKA